VPPEEPWYRLHAVDSYRAIHEWIVQALGQMGLDAEIATECRAEGPGQCFIGHERFDVLWKGRKIAGAAQRRNRQGLLIQGSLQPPPMLEAQRVAWHAAMVARAPAGFFRSAAWRDSLPEPVVQEANRLAGEKYSRPEYNGRR